VSSATVRVREACEADREFLLSLVPRLRAFGTVPLRTEAEHDGAERRAIERALASPSSEHVLFVAELDALGPAGVALAETATDYFTGERHAHLGILAVAAALNVFADNLHAREVYERAGFSPDTIRYAKPLGARGDS
jgi:hypothetical protein